MAEEKILEASNEGDGKYKLECSSCYFEFIIENPEQDDVYECEDCGSPFAIVEVSGDKVKYQAVVFDEEEWRE
ncbi:MAG: hypothetical protein ACTSR8_11355 [Promethearchaeota archaeon]